MALDARQIVTQATTFIRGLTVRQKVILGASLVGATGAVWLFVALMGRSDYKPLYTGLSPEDAQAISQRLAAADIPFELSSDRTSLSVPADQMDKVRLQMASEGLPVTGRLGFELFDKPNWAGSDFYEQVNYQRALEGELERTIESLSDVQGARVHLVLPKESLFTESEQPAKAAVLVKLRGPRLSDESINSITYLVASSVENLKPENVTVVDADGRVPISNRGNNRRMGSQGDAEYENTLAQKLIATLSPVVGVDHIRASVSVDFDTASSDTTQETYDPNGSVVLTSQTSSDQIRDGGAEGIPGTTSNVPQAKVADASKTPAATPNSKSPQAAATSADNSSDVDGASQGEKTESKTFAVSKTLRHTLQSPGSVKRISAVVLVDDAEETKVENGKEVESRRKRTADELKQIQDLASGAIGIDPTRGDHLTVESLSFLEVPKETPAEPTLADRVLPAVRQWSSLIRYGLLFLLFLAVYLLILRPLKKQMLMSLRPMRPALPAVQEPVLVGATATPIRPTETPEAFQLESDATPEAKRQDEMRRAIAKRVEKEPEEASRVIQSWLMDDEGAA